jgi:hypothetical protein
VFLSHFSFKKGGSGELETLFFDFWNRRNLKRDSLCVAQPKHGGTRVNSIQVGGGTVLSAIGRRLKITRAKATSTVIISYVAIVGISCMSEATGALWTMGREQNQRLNLGESLPVGLSLLGTAKRGVIS